MSTSLSFSNGYQATQPKEFKFDAERVFPRNDSLYDKFNKREKNNMSMVQVVFKKNQDEKVKTKNNDTLGTSTSNILHPNKNKVQILLSNQSFSPSKQLSNKKSKSTVRIVSTRASPSNLVNFRNIKVSPKYDYQ